MGKSRMERPNFGDRKRSKNPKGQEKGERLVKSTWKQQNQRGKKGVDNIDDNSKSQKKKKNQRYLSKKDKKKMEEEIPIEYVSSDFVAKQPEFEGYVSESEDNLSDGDEGRSVSTEEKTRKKGKGGGFQSLGLSYPLLKGILRRGYKVPTPIQRKTLPVILAGKDVVAMARTGSGKTAAFLIPLFQKLKTHCLKGMGPRGLILSPTRELALQTYSFAKEIAKYTDLKISVILGGDSMEHQFEVMHSNPDIIIATPGRLLHVLVEMKTKLSAMEYVVFDEADRLFELGFQEQLTEIVNRLPESRQTLLFSATLPKSLVEFAKAGLNEPELIRLDVESKLSDLLKLTFFTVREEDKDAVLLHLLKNVIDFETQMTVVFVATRHHVEWLQDMLNRSGISATHVYSSLDPEARKININAFRSRRVRVLIVTDLAARGIDIPLLDNVVNYNFPCKPKLFVHRVGRVARAGRTGTAFSFVAPEEVPFLIDLHLFLGRDVKFTSSDSREDQDGIIGSVPQTIIDEEADPLIKWESDIYEVSSMKKVCKNALKQYVKSRGVPSGEAVKKSKNISFSSILPHPVFSTVSVATNEGKEASSTLMTNLLQSLKSYKPAATIFEINSNKKNDAFDIMASKRKLHDKKVKVSKDTIPTEETHDKDFRDKNFYLSYNEEGHETEKGLAIEGIQRNELDSVVLDVVGDEDRVIRKNKSLMKWDRKKKRFINESGAADPKKKKIKTESGAWIPASYSSDLYRKWKEKKAGVMDDGDNETQFAANYSRKGHRGGPTSWKNKNVKSELKRPEQILKERKQKEKKRKFLESRMQAKSGKGGKKASGQDQGRGGRRRK